MKGCACENELAFVAEASDPPSDRAMKKKIPLGQLRKEFFASRATLDRHREYQLWCPWEDYRRSLWRRKSPESRRRLIEEWFRAVHYYRKRKTFKDRAKIWLACPQGPVRWLD